MCVLFAGLTSTSDVFQNVGRLFETFVVGSSSLRSDDAVFVCGSLCSPPGKAFHILQKPLRLLLADRWVRVYVLVEAFL